MDWVPTVCSNVIVFSVVVLDAWFFLMIPEHPSVNKHVYPVTRSQFNIYPCVKSRMCIAHKIPSLYYSGLQNCYLIIIAGNKMDKLGIEPRTSRNIHLMQSEHATTASFAHTAVAVTSHTTRLCPRKSHVFRNSRLALWTHNNDDI